ncbi:MAG: family 43 glycosylhydrolase [Chitinophagaceae bacterium]
MLKKKSILFLAIATLSFNAFCQLGVRYDPTVQPTANIQYFKPIGNLFVGDCIPFYHNSTYYLYWLLDSGHHSALGGLGGHQWALSTSTDLKNWKHYPVVLGIDEAWEKSICTGSVVYYKNKFYAFYATRLIDSDGKVNEQLSYAISDDGIHFNKQKPNPFYTSAPGYSKRNFRDPKVSVDDNGVFHLFVSSAKEESATHDNGALVHLISKDLTTWTVQAPLIYGESDVPECPDYFQWKGWYYLVYGQGGNTLYLKSKAPYGPWEYPRYQALNEDWVNVAKTAAFTNGRRIVAGWIPNKKNNEDNGHEIFGGNIILRELGQEADGTLNTSFPVEAVPATSAAISSIDSKTITTANGLSAYFFENLPADYTISFEAEQKTTTDEFGIYLRSDKDAGSSYKLSISPQNRTVALANTHITAVEGLDKKIKVQVVVKGDVIDVCINGKRCIDNRLYEKKGNFAGIFAKHGTVTFSAIKIASLK